MIIRAGSQTVEFQRSFELPKLLTFATRDDAVKLLKQIGFLDSQAMLEVRSWLRRFSDDPDGGRLTDYEAIERMAGLLYSGKVVAVARQQGGGSGPGDPKAPAPVIAFPLSERSPRISTASSNPVQPEDPPTFTPKLDPAVQAAALVAAAEAGKPFCPE